MFCLLQGRGLRLTRTGLLPEYARRKVYFANRRCVRWVSNIEDKS